MTFSVVKERLHNYIDNAEEDKVKAIYTLVESEIGPEEYSYDDETLNMLEERREEYINSNVKGLTVEESMDLIKKELIKRGL